MFDMSWIWIEGIFVVYGGVFLKWFLDDRRRQKKTEKEQKRNALFWSIRDKEMDLYGKWLD